MGGADVEEQLLIFHFWKVGKVTDLRNVPID